MYLNKYKRALVSLAKIAFLEEPETEYGDNVVRQILYRHLYSLKIIDYKDGKFIYKEKEKMERKT